MKPQVKKDFYFKKKYRDLNRFISYYYQIEMTLKVLNKGDKVLEIGIGDRVFSDYLKKMGIDIATCDFDKDLKPDYVADVKNLGVAENSFDVILAYEILEHLPFDDFAKCLKELKRASKKYVIISLPYRSACFEIIIKFPFIRTILKKQFIDIFLRIPLNFEEGISRQHFWEIDKNKFSFKKVRNIITNDFKIIKEFRPPVDYHHYFFILEIV